MARHRPKSQTLRPRWVADEAIASEHERQRFGREWPHIRQRYERNSRIGGFAPPPSSRTPLFVFPVATFVFIVFTVKLAGIKAGAPHRFSHRN